VLLDKVYAEDELYSKKLKNIIEEEQLKDKF
jgi:flagellum-specific peptidoglycan hydrolase FlgJ